MQIAVNKVVEKLLNELPGSEDMAVDEVKPLNGTDCRLFAELTKDNHTVAVLKRQKCGNESDKNIADDKETNVNPELRIKIDLKRKQANYIDSDDKTAAADMLTVKKVKIDSEVLIEEEKKVSPLKKELKVPEKNEEKDKLVRLSSKEMSAEIEKLAKKLLSNRSSTEIGELKLKVSTLEKKVDFWKRQYWNLQKEVTECNIGVQRVSQNLKKNVPFPAVKVSTRHVGLQVQQVQIPAVRAPLNMNRPSFTTKVVSQKDYRQDLPSIAPSPSTSIASPTKYIPATLPIAAVPTQKLQPSVSVSILQPKPQTNISLPSNLLVPSTGTSVIPKVASVVPPTAVPTVRSALDFQRKVQATSANPIPMRLVANQANQAAKQANPTAVRPTLTAVTPGAVKIIDLTADEDEAKAKRVTRAFQLAATTPAASLSNTTITPIKPANAVNITNQRPLAIFAAPVSQASVGTNQIFLAATQSSMVRYPVTSIRTTNSTQSLINSGSKLTYLVPTAGLPRGSLLIAPNQNRPLQLHPPIQTLLMQRGTTLFPVTSGTGTTQSIKTVVTPGIRNPTVVTAAVPVLTSSLPIQSGVQMTQMTSVQKPPAPVVTTTTASPVTPTITTSTNVNTNINTVTTTASTATASSTVDVTKQAVVVSRVSPKHPAPLPVFQTSIQSLNSTTLKHIPPKPALKISKVTNGIVLSWNMNLNTLHADISCYQLFAYQETSAAPSPTLWKKVGDVKALALPMACTLTQFVDGHKYHFAVRALDVHKRVGPFSDAGSIVLPTTSSSSTSTNATPTSK
uniref:Activating transcription factor 7-interacting protein Fn3 domain-containing protein n=1 Tax=Strigamia maritima TaxID=126957 RepID=T1J388_STRMM